MAGETCPSCTHALEDRDLRNAILRFCATGCQGVLVALPELQKIDHSSKGVPRLLQEIVDTAPGDVDDNRDPRVCPDCDSEMEAVPHPKAENIVVDICEPCQAVFLDGAELAELRARQLSEEEIGSAAELRKRRAIRSRWKEMSRLRKEAVVRRARGHGLWLDDAPLFY